MAVVASACAPRVRVPPTPLAFRTPEAAALAAAWRSGDWVPPRPPLVINVPPDERNLQDLLAQDLSAWVSPIIGLHDSTRYATAQVSEQQLATWHAVYDVRPASQVYTPAQLRRWGFAAGAGPADSVRYTVDVEGCRHWPCHSGFVVQIRSDSAGYVALVLGHWMQ